MGSDTYLLRSPSFAKALIGEARLALMIYGVVGLVGIGVTIGAARLGHPLFSLVADDSIGNPVQNTEPAAGQKPATPPVSTPRLGASEIPVARLFQENPNKYEKIVPKNPSIVVGVVLFDTQQRLVGRVIAVNIAPVITTENGAAQVTDHRLFVTIENQNGVAQLIDYGSIEWRAISSSKIAPDVGVITTSLAPSSIPHQ